MATYSLKNQLTIVQNKTDNSIVIANILTGKLETNQIVLLPKNLSAINSSVIAKLPETYDYSKDIKILRQGDKAVFHSSISLSISKT